MISSRSAVQINMIASIDTTRILIGDQVNILYEVEHNKLDKDKKKIHAQP